MTDDGLTDRQREILDFIVAQQRERGYPPVGPRDRRGGRPHLALHGAHPPGHAAAARLPAARPDQAPRHRGPLRPGVRRHASSAGPSATCRWSATSPPAPTCWPHENVEELLPLPADFTGDGDLFMLRVRGDSMIDAGILDGDYVVVPPAARGRQRRDRRGRHPRRGGHGEDLHAARAPRSCCSRPTRGSTPMEFDPPRSRSSARSSPCSAASERRARSRRCQTGRASAGRAGRRRARSIELDARPARRRCGRASGRRDRGWPPGSRLGEAGHVGPAELGAHRQAAALDERGQQRVGQTGHRRRRHIAT